MRVALLGAVATIAAMIVDYRSKKGMSQSQFAEHAGMSQGTVSRLERGDTKFLHESSLKKFAKGIGKSFKDVNDAYIDAYNAEQERGEEAPPPKPPARRPEASAPQIDPETLTSFLGAGQEMRIPVAIRGTVILKIEQVEALDMDD